MREIPGAASDRRGKCGFGLAFLSVYLQFLHRSGPPAGRRRARPPAVANMARGTSPVKIVFDDGRSYTCPATWRRQTILNGSADGDRAPQRLGARVRVIVEAAGAGEHQ